MNNSLITITLSSVIILCCLTFMGFILFTDSLEYRISGSRRTIFVIILALYTILRTFRLIKAVKGLKVKAD